MSKIGWQSGFESIMSKRATMHNWTTLQALLNQGANREAVAIVRSFENSMDFSTYDVYEEHYLAS